MAEALTSYFASVSTVEDTYEIPNIITAQSNLILLSNFNFTEDKVTEVFDKIEVNKPLVLIIFIQFG